MLIYEQILEAFLTTISHLYLLKNKLKGKSFTHSYNWNF